MAFKSLLTPFLGDDVEETLASFMNMKFKEVHDNTLDNRNQISISLEKTRVLEVDRGYLNSKGISNINPDTLVNNGTYYITEPSGIPTGLQNPNGYLKVHTSGTPGFLSQTYIPVGDNRMFFRRCFNSAWQPWTEIATTTKIDILCTAGTGFVISDQNNYRINNVIYYNLFVRKTDSTAFAINESHVVAVMPTGQRPPSTVTASACGIVGTSWLGVAGAVLGASGNINLVTSVSGMIFFKISGVVVLL